MHPTCRQSDRSGGVLGASPPALYKGRAPLTALPHHTFPLPFWNSENGTEVTSQPEVV